MSPVTHFFSGWVLANCAKLDRRDRALVTLACVIPDIDGLGIIPEILTRNSAHPLLWFSLYHHSLHNLAFALLVAAVAFAIATRRWTTGIARPAELSLASTRRRPWLPRPGRRSVADPLSRSVFFSCAIDVERSVGTQRVAQRSPDDHFVAHHTLAGVAARILATRNDLCEGRRLTGCCASSAFSAQGRIEWGVKPTA